MSFLISFNKICGKKLIDFKRTFETSSNEYQKSISTKKRIFTKYLNRGLIEKDEIIQVFEKELENVEKFKTDQIECFVQVTKKLLENYPVQTLQSVNDYKNSISNQNAVAEHKKTRLNDLDENSYESKDHPLGKLPEIKETDDSGENENSSTNKHRKVKEIGHMIQSYPLEEIDKIRNMISQYLETIANTNVRKRSMNNDNESGSSKKSKVVMDAVPMINNQETSDIISERKLRSMSTDTTSKDKFTYESANTCNVDTEDDSISVEPVNIISQVDDTINSTNIQPTVINDSEATLHLEDNGGHKSQEIQEEPTKKKTSILKQASAMDSESNDYVPKIAKATSQPSSSVKSAQNKSSTSITTPSKNLYYSKYYKKISEESAKKKAIESSQKKMQSSVHKKPNVPVVNNKTQRGNKPKDIHQMDNRFNDMKQQAAMRINMLQKERLAYKNVAGPSSYKVGLNDVKKNPVENVPITTVTNTTAFEHMKSQKFESTSSSSNKSHMANSVGTKKLVPSKDNLKSIVKTNMGVSKGSTKSHLKTPKSTQVVSAKKLIKDKENIEPPSTYTKQTNMSISESSTQQPKKSRPKTKSLQKKTRPTDVLSQSFLVIIDNHETVDIEELPSDSDDDDESMIRSLPCPDWSKNPAIINRLQEYNGRYLKPTNIFRSPQLLDINLERMFARYGYKEKAPRGSSIWLPNERNPRSTSDETRDDDHQE